MSHTPGPWVQFADQGKCVAIMPAMREGDVCTFKQSPSDDDARLIMASPALLKALQALDLLLDFGDDEVGQSWFFEDTSAIQEAFAEARAALELANSRG